MVMFSEMKEFKLLNVKPVRFRWEGNEVEVTSVRIARTKTRLKNKS